MVWAVFTDQEAVDLLDAAAEMAAAALAARSRRVDEDGVIARSVDMSRLKLATLRQAFRSAPLIEWAEMTPAAQGEFCRLVSILRDGASEKEQAVVWKTLRTLMLRPGSQEPLALGSDPWGDDDLPKPAVPGGEASPAAKPSRVRKVRGKSSD